MFGIVDQVEQLLGKVMSTGLDGVPAGLEHDRGPSWSVERPAVDVGQ